jgi:hypothetical protein
VRFRGLGRPPWDLTYARRDERRSGFAARRKFSLQPEK